MLSKSCACWYELNYAQYAICLTNRETDLGDRDKTSHAYRVSCGECHAIKQHSCFKQEKQFYEKFY